MSIEQPASNPYPGWTRNAAGEWVIADDDQPANQPNASGQPIGRSPSGDGGSPQPGGSSPHDQQLPLSPRERPVYVPSPLSSIEAAAVAAAASAGTGSSESAARVLEELGTRFVELRKGGKASAWRRLQEDIMTSLSVLCPAVLSLKDALAAAREIEDFLKGVVDTKGRSNEDVLREAITTGCIAGKPLVGMESLDDALARAAIDATAEDEQEMAAIDAADAADAANPDPANES